MSDPTDHPVTPATAAAQPLVSLRRRWSDPWQHRPEILCDACDVDAVLPQAATARLRRDYGRMKDFSETAFSAVGPLITGLHGWFVRVQTYTAAGGLQTAFLGRIERDADAVGGLDANARGTGSQQYTAYGLESLLGKAPITGSYVLADGRPQHIDTVLAFNALPSGGAAMLGNRSADRVTVRGQSCYAFDPTSSATWSCADIAEYLLAAFAPTDPSFGLLDTGVLAAQVRVIHPQPDLLRTLASLTDRRMGCAFVVGADDAEEAVTLFAVSRLAESLTVGDVTLPAAEPDAVREVNLDHEDVAGEVVLERIESSRFGRITVRGEHLWEARTVGLSDGLSVAWSSSTQADYDTDTPANRASQERYAPVYRDFAMTVETSCGRVNDDGTVDTAGSYPLVTRGRELTRQLPLREGYTYGTGEAVSDAEASGDFRPPAVYARNAAEEWQDLARRAPTPGEPGRAHVATMRGRMGLRIRGPYGHWLADGTFAAEDTADRPVFDYRDLQATVAYRTDQRLAVRWRADRPGDGEHLVIDVPGAECWVVRDGTIYGVAGGNRLVTEGVQVLRNDREQLQAVLAAVRSFHGRTRYACRFSLRGVRRPRAYEVGEVLAGVTVHNTPYRTDAMVTRVRLDFQRQSTTVETEFAALDYRRRVDAGRGVRALHHDPAAAPAEAALASPADPAGSKTAGVVQLRNDSGTDRSRFNVLGVAGVVASPGSDLEAFQDRPVLTGQTPDADEHTGRFAVLAESIADGETGLAVVTGVVPVQINVTDENHRFADVNDGVATSLESGPFGSARILYKPAGTGTVWGLVRLGVGCEGTRVSPKVLTGSGNTADTETWDIDDPPAGTDGVEFTPFRLYWSGDSGDPVYQFVRTPTYDSNGRLVAVSAEARSAAFDTDTCEDA